VIAAVEEERAQGKIWKPRFAARGDDRHKTELNHQDPSNDREKVEIVTIEHRVGCPAPGCARSVNGCYRLLRREIAQKRL